MNNKNQSETSSDSKYRTSHLTSTILNLLVDILKPNSSFFI